VSLRYRAVIPLALAIGLLAAGCGSDSSGETTTPSVSIPAVTSPVSTTSTTAPTTTPRGTTTGSTTFNPQEPDSETNDVPPKKGSPEAAFEQQCKANPDACG
jgi:hypothetical protein